MKKPIPFGKYYLLERINVGGMAEVFRAKAFGVEGFERLVAVKRILPNIAEDKEFIKMFVDEAKISVQLNHANIAQIFDLGMVDGSYYIALEHIHGRDMRAIFDRCRNQGAPMPVSQACFVVMKVCEGLDYAHNKRDSSGRPIGLVHRDVSPQNVLVSFEGEVKLIDFGIAKAAGKGSKTQAGILKGKFGYMSPEQVRGLPIDRRSDIFSCGILLYELLTGERLFVGESDFSTLEKVRNVEILPPSTYNRKIPDELERIVLKALAKDVEERYQNAIDLHDELQAFVYTAGEFYSRKDLAAWSKRVWAREIEEESVKLESFRQLRPPAVRGAQGRQAPKRAMKATLAMPTMAPAPPPIPGRSGGAPAAAAGVGGGLEWDDEELETQIYEGTDEMAAQDPAIAAMAAAPLTMPSTIPGGRSPSAGGVGGGLATAAEAEPDLSSLVQTAKGWETPGGLPPEPTPAGSPPPSNLANGSSNSPSPFAVAPGQATPDQSTLSEGFGQPEPPRPPPVRDSSAVVDLVELAKPIFEASVDANTSYATPEAKPRGGMIVMLAAAAILLIGGGVGLYLALSGGDAKVTAQAAAGSDDKDDGVAGTADRPNQAMGPNASASKAVAISPEVLAKTGFDLYVEPTAIKHQVTIKVDGKVYATQPPAQFRNLKPGDVTVEIEGPKPYGIARQVVTVVAGEAGRVTLTLSAKMVMTRFETTPPGAEVTLVSDGQRMPLGPSPASHKLDPAKRYEVIFEKPNYVGQTKPIEFTGQPEQSVVALLARASVASRTAPRNPDPLTRRPPKRTRPKASGSDPFAEDPDPPKKDPPKADPPKRDPPKRDPPKEAKGSGTLMLGAKPPCQIYIGGKNTGKKTPQRALKLPAGRHKITLVNNQHNIKESFYVVIKANQSSKVIKNMMSRIGK